MHPATLSRPLADRPTAGDPRVYQRHIVQSLTL